VGPTIWILAGVLYLFNVIEVRSIAWGISFIAILMMLARLARS
jgi:uncharacterized MAPEG superfamily protein